MLHDENRTLTIDDLVAPEKAGAFTQNITEVLNFSFNRAAFWLKFTVENRTVKTQERVLEVEFPLVDDIRFYGVKSLHVTGR